MKIELKRYNKNFPKYFQKESRKLSRLGKFDIYHIGSTAVKGLSGKGWIDIMIILKKKNIKLKDIIKKLEKLGYKIAKIQRKERIFLFKQKGKLRYNLHLYIKKNKKAIEQIKFRDFLRKNPKEARKYGIFKRNILKKAKGDRITYKDLKDSYFKRIIKKLK